MGCFHIGQLPSSSCLGFHVFGATAVAMCLDCVFPPCMLVSGKDAMSIGRVGTCGAGYAYN